MKSIAAAAVLLLLIAANARADGFLVPVRRELPVRGPWAVTNHLVTIKVDGQRAFTEVRQSFRNLTRTPLEVTYLFPVPEGAVIDGFSLIVDGKEMVGQLLPADQATRIYEEIVRSKKDPALLTYAGRGLVRTSVFPIPAGGSREVVVRYSELLRKEGDFIRLVYPLDTERFSARPIEVVDVKVEIDSERPLRAVYSPSHPVRVTRSAETRAVARWARERIVPDQDFVLYWATSGEDVGASLLSYWPEGERAGHFLLLLSPKATLDPRMDAGKNVTIVLDHSGSMKGDKIRQAKAALRYVLESLSPRDRVNVVAFSSTVETLFDSPKIVTEDVRKMARVFVTGLTANGGTDIHGALTTALHGMPEDSARRNTILFLTDGLPTVGVRDTAEILRAVTRANAGIRDARLFVFGVGYDVNAQFLDRLVEDNGGIGENVTPGQSVEIVVTSLYRKIRHAVLSDLLLRFEGIETFDVYPRRLPDLFHGSQLVISGRYRQGGSGGAVLAGRESGQRRAFRYPLRFETGSDPDEKPFVARVWATMKIGFLIDQMRLMKRREPELVTEIVRLSTKYGIVTEYTAFLADERNDFRAVARNRMLTEEQFVDKLGRESGGSGVNQALNVRGMRARQQAQSKNEWRDADGKTVTVHTVRNIGRKTFYRRGGVWIDREVREDEKADEVVTQMSARFFELVREQRAVQNRWLTFRDPVVVRIGDRVVRFVPATENGK